MSGDFEVQPEDLRKYAKNIADDVARIRKIRNKIDQVSLAAGSFGKLPESDELAKDYEEQRTNSLKDLKDAATALEDVADAVKATASAYDQTEDDVNVRYGGK